MIDPVGLAALASRRIVLTTFGSLGDLHPYVAIATELRRRGHDARIATLEMHRTRVESRGVPFHPLRPDLPGDFEATGLLERAMDRRTGSEFIVREMLMPVLRQTWEDTLAAAEGADVLVSHPLTFTTRIAAELRRIRWVSSMLAPIGFFSAHDPPVVPMAFLNLLRPLGPAFHRPLFKVFRMITRHWCDPVHDLRRELGLPPAGDPLFDAAHSPLLDLALFSPAFAPPQPDWPAAMRATGFPFFDEPDVALDPALDRFLDAGPPPVAFTLGSSAVLDAGSFYEVSAAAVRQLGRRGVLLTGPDGRNRPASLPTSVAAFEYAPYAAIFPRTAAIVHQGGIGTTAQALRAGKPMLVMPYAHDQPDNAARVERLGVARTVARERYAPGRAVRELRRILDDPAYATRAADVGARVRAEDGVSAACDALAGIL